MAFLPYPVIDLYIRAFVSGSQPHSGHRYFIDLRPNTPGHLWLGFALSPKGTVAGADSRLQRAVSVVGNTSRFFQRSIKGSVSGRYPVIPLLGISVRKAVAFPSLLPLCRISPTQSLYATTCRYTVEFVELPKPEERVVPVTDSNAQLTIKTGGTEVSINNDAPTELVTRILEAIRYAG